MVQTRIEVEVRRHGLGKGSWHVYSAMGTSPAGDIYSGLCDYSLAHRISQDTGGAHLVRYDPVEGRSYDLGDVQDVTGEDDPEMHPQSKIHTPIVFTPDGRAYLGTHSVERDYTPPGHGDRFPKGYPGGHWVSYDPSTGVMNDLGIGVPGESLMGLAIDPAGNRLCATTHKGSLLVEYDIGEGTTTVIGGIGKYPTRTVAYLKDGCAHTFDDKGHVVRYDPAAGELDVMDLRVPNGGFEAGLQTVFATCTDPGRERLYGVSSLLHGEKYERRGGYLFEYDGEEVTDLGNAAVVSGTSTAEADLYHAIAYGRDDNVYYWAPTRGKPSHLVRYDTGSGERVDLGELWADDYDAFVLAVFASCTGTDGRLYFGGLLRSEHRPEWVHEAVLMILDPSSY